MNILPVPLVDVPAVWPVVLPFAEKIARVQPEDWPLSVIKSMAEDGRIKLWLIGDGEGPLAAVGATSIVEKNSGGLICALRWVAGSGPRRWAHLLAHVEDWAKMQGCSAVRLDFGKHKAWTRLLPGYRAQTVTRLTKEL